MSKVSSKINKKSEVLLRPRITEKATMLASMESPVYVFEIDSRFNKLEVAKAVKDLYNVTPVRVNIVNIPAKKVFRRGAVGQKSAVKKALVYLKKGQKIEFV